MMDAIEDFWFDLTRSNRASRILTWLTVIPVTLAVVTVIVSAISNGLVDDPAGTMANLVSSNTK